MSNSIGKLVVALSAPTTDFNNSLAMATAAVGQMAGQTASVAAPIESMVASLDMTSGRVSKLTKGLIDQASTFGLTAEQTKVYKLAMAGADQATIQAAVGLEQHVAALQKSAAEHQRLEQVARGAFESTRTPAERYRAKLDDLKKAAAAGKISQDTLARATKALNIEFNIGPPGAFAKALHGIRSAASSAAGGVSSMVTSLTGGLSGMLAAGGALVGVGGAAAALSRSVMLAANMEQLKIGFTTLLGSGEAAEKMLGDITTMAASTPFQFDDLADSVKRLLAMGFAGDQAIGVMRTLGDTTSALGAGPEVMNRMVLALGQMQAKGKVSAQEMNQFAEAGVPAWEMLASKIGVSIPQAMKMAEAGAISAATAVPAILSGMSDKFGGAMQAQSQTLLGLFSTLKDTVDMTLRSIGETLVKEINIKEVLKDVIGFVGAVGSAGPLVVTALGYMGTAIGFVADLVNTLKLGFQVMGGATSIVLGLFTKNIAIAAQGVEAFLNMLPGVSVHFSDGVTMMADNLLEAGNQSISEAYAAAQQPPPSEKLAGWFNSLKTRADAAAVAAQNVGEKTNQFVVPAQEAAATATGKFIEKLQQEIETYGMSSDQAELYKLKKAGATQAELDQAQALIAEKDSLKEHTDLQKEAARVIDSIKTPTQKYEEQIASLDKMLTGNALTQDQYSLAVEKAKAELDKATADAGDPGAAGADVKSGSFKMVDLNTLAVGGLARSANKPQEIKSKQLDRSNELLEEMLDQGFYGRAA